MARFSRSVIAALVLCAGAGLLASCAGPALEPEPEIHPIHLGDQGSPSIEFDHVVIQIPYGQVIGHAYRWSRELFEIRYDQEIGRSTEFNVAAASELKKSGYSVYELADRMFASETPKVARLHLGGVLDDLEVNRYLTHSQGPESRSDARMEIEFRLFDALNDQVVFERTYVGRGRDEGSNPNPITPAFVDALHHLLADASFVEQVKEIGSAASPATGTEGPISIEQCPGDSPSPLPDGMDQLMESFVRVLVGGTSGSGVIISSTGYVLTAAHLVKADEEITVQLSSGLRLNASLVRADTGQDVALLRLSGSGFPCAPARSGDDLPPIGTEIYALGTPMDPRLDRSVSKGVVSGYRDIEGFRFIQTDTSLNPGHSGGPLFDGEGRLIGIISFKIVALGVEGIGFGVPMDVIERRLQIVWRD